MTKYRLEMTEKQARCLVAALDLAIRVRLGQWGEIVEQCLDLEPGKTSIDEYCKKREEAVNLLFEARRVVMPELQGCACYGVYSKETTERAFNLLLAVRSCMAWHNEPDGGITVDFDKPLAVNVSETLPKCEAVEDGQ